MNKTLIITRLIFFAFIALLAHSADVFAQARNYSGLVSGVHGSNLKGAELGMLVCEDAEGKTCICSGALEETVLGIVTNTPYITINKPLTPEGSSYVFEARVSEMNGQIMKGEYLKAVAGGELAKCEKDELPLAYAVAIEPSIGRQKIKVKVLR